EPSTSRFNSNSLSDSDSLDGGPPSSRLSSNSLLLLASSPPLAGLGVVPGSRLSSNSISSLPPCSREMPLSTGSCRLMPLAPAAPDRPPRVTSSSLFISTGTSSLPSSTGDDDPPSTASSKSLLSDSVFGGSLDLVEGPLEAGPFAEGVPSLTSSSDSSNGE